MKRRELELRVIGLQNELASLRARPSPERGWVGHLVTVGIAVATGICAVLVSVPVTMAVTAERLKSVSDELEKVRIQAKGLETQTAVIMSHTNLTNGQVNTLLQTHEIEVAKLRGDIVDHHTEIAKAIPKLDAHDRDAEAAKVKLDKLASDLTLVRERVASLEAQKK